MIAYNPDEKIQSTRENVRPWGVRRKNLLHSATKNVHLLRRFSGNLQGISRVCTHFVGSNKPTIVLTHNKLVTRFFQTKAIPPAWWNTCVYILQFNFKITHIGGSINKAADFFSRLELKVTEKMRLKIREDIQTTPIELTTPSSDVSHEEQFFFTQTDNESESEEQTF